MKHQPTTYAEWHMLYHDAIHALGRMTRAHFFWRAAGFPVDSIIRQDVARVQWRYYCRISRIRGRMDLLTPELEVSIKISDQARPEPSDQKFNSGPCAAEESQ